MIIGVDAGCLGVNDNRLKVGVYHMGVGLFSALSKVDRKNFYRLYSFFPISQDLLRKFGKRVENKIIKPSFGWMKIWLPLELLRNPVDVFLGLSQTLPKLPFQTKGIVFVHDLTFEKYPQWFKDSYFKMSHNTKFAVKEADQVVAVSHATKEDLVRLYKVPNKKISVIYEGFSHNVTNESILSLKEIKEKFGITKPFFLFVGALKPSKNIPNIIKAFYEFSKYHNKYQLVICGSNYWLDPEIYQTLKKIPNKEKVKVLGFVGNRELITLYKNAYGFVSPSYNEGFGLTFLEAANFKLPIIASNTGSVFEILRNGAYYVNPENVDEISQAFEKIATDKKLRTKLITLARKHTQKISWQKSAIQLLGLIQSYEKR